VSTTNTRRASRSAQATSAKQSLRAYDNAPSVAPTFALRSSQHACRTTEQVSHAALATVHDTTFCVCMRACPWTGAVSASPWEHCTSDNRPTIGRFSLGMLAGVRRSTSRGAKPHLRKRGDRAAAMIARRAEGRNALRSHTAHRRVIVHCAGGRSFAARATRRSGAMASQCMMARDVYTVRLRARDGWAHGERAHSHVNESFVS
jgi:hypothetical protein